MASSGEVEVPALARPVDDEMEVEAAGSGEGALPAVASPVDELGVEVTGSGEGKRCLLHSLDYPCTARFRHRRLLAYLRGHGSAGVYEAARASMPVIFHVKDLVKKVKEGQLREAGYYVNRFAPLYQSGYEARLLMLFLQDLTALSDFSNGRVMVASYLCDWFISMYRTPMLDKYPCYATLVVDVLFLRSDHARAFFDWQLIKNKAAKMVEKMAYKTPELRDKMQYPCGQNNLYHVVPIGSRRRKKNVGPKQSTSVTQFYLQMRKRLPSSEGECYSGLAMARGEPLIALLETSLAAGKRLVHEQVQPPELLSNEDFPLVQAKRAAGFRGYTRSSQGRHPELSSKLDTSRCLARVDSQETSSAKKRSRDHDSCRDTVHPGINPKRPQTTGNFGEDQSSRFNAPHLLAINEGTA
ncbi:unnamed protein product [Urochloa decumbens]|uniref:Uncharacterized protein n=1 Tax=Urochloa decumbens TaxID=240449 RepID=A0ABC9C7G8_9POAL